MTTTHLWRKFVGSVCVFILLILLAACAGVGTNGAITSITGTISKVDSASHSVTLTVGGQNYTISGLSDQEIQALTTQVGKMYTVHVTQNSDGSFSLTIGTNPTLANNETPGVNEGPEGTETPESGETPSASSQSDSISFTGPLQSASSSSVTATMPDGSALTVAINAQSDLNGLNSAQLHAGQSVKIEALASSNGFVAKSVKLADTGDQNDAHSVDFKGHASGQVGSDKILHFTVGSRSFSYALGNSVDLGDFGGNASSIASGTAIKVTVVFNGTTGTVSKVSNSNN